jgi:DNA-binding MarR family transcriptional regulator
MMNEENDPLSDKVFHQVLALMRLQRQYARKIIDEQGIRPRDMSVLRFLSEHDEVTVSQVQHYIHHSPSTTSTMLSNMEKDGFLNRTRSQTDNRVVLLTLTDAGRALLTNTPLGGLPLLRRKLQALPAGRLDEMLVVLADIQEMMTGEAAE